jgi:hypothetical protein
MVNGLRVTSPSKASHDEATSCAHLQHMNTDQAMMGSSSPILLPSAGQTPVHLQLIKLTSLSAVAARQRLHLSLRFQR